MFLRVMSYHSRMDTGGPATLGEVLCFPVGQKKDIAQRNLRHHDDRFVGRGCCSHFTRGRLSTDEAAPRNSFRASSLSPHVVWKRQTKSSSDSPTLVRSSYTDSFVHLVAAGAPLWLRLCLQRVLCATADARSISSFSIRSNQHVLDAFCCAPQNLDIGQGPQPRVLFWQALRVLHVQIPDISGMQEDLRVLSFFFLKRRRHHGTLQTKNSESFRCLSFGTKGILGKTCSTLLNTSISRQNIEKSRSEDNKKER